MIALATAAACEMVTLRWLQRMHADGDIALATADALCAGNTARVTAGVVRRW